LRNTDWLETDRTRQAEVRIRSEQTRSISVYLDRCRCLLENCNVEKLNLRMFRTEQHRPSRCDLARGWWMKVAGRTRTIPAHRRPDRYLGIWRPRPGSDRPPALTLMGDRCVLDNGCLRHCVSCASTKYLKKPPDGRARQVTIARSKHGNLILKFVITVILLRNVEPEYKITKREEQLPRGNFLLDFIFFTMLVEFFHSIIIFLFPKDCFEELILNFNIFNSECVSLVCSRLLGVGIVAGASLVKVPQILNIVFARSGAGVSVFSQLLELLCYTAAVAYSINKNYHFSAWGESLFLSLQTFIIIFLVLYYYKRFIALTVVSSFYGFCCYHVYNGSVWENVLDSVQMMTIVIMFIARATQAVDNYIHKSTGQLSAVTYILLFLGSLARIFTSVKETGDNMIIAQYMMSTLMNLFICLQIQLYWGNKRSLKTE
ncbi:Mannose-P-dolichol utilization defect 1 protein, partial [Trichinella sp. T9]